MLQRSNGAEVARSAAWGWVVDLGINLLGSQEPEIDFEPLLQDPFVLAARADHPLAARAEVARGDLAPYRFITVGRLSGNRPILDLGLAGVAARPRWFYEVQHLSASLGLVEAGLGVAALPRVALPKEPHPRLVVLPLVAPSLSRTMGVLRRRGARRFCEMLMARWADRPAPPQAGFSRP